MSADRLIEAAEAMVLAYDSCAPEWWPPEVDELRDAVAVGRGDPPVSPDEAEALARRLDVEVQITDGAGLVGLASRLRAIAADLRAPPPPLKLP